MFHFRLGRIPIGVHFSHLLFSAFLAYSWKPNRVAAVWPDLVLGDPAHPAYLWTLGVFMAAWMAIIFLSVLVHELGHAGASLAFGYRPTIQLEWMGGHTQPNPNETIPWHRDVLLTLAGPIAGVLLGVLSFFAARALGGVSEPLNYFLARLVEVNAFWALLNLLPVPPLDGGRLATTLSVRLFGRRGFLLAQILSLLCVAAIVLFFASRGGLEDNILLVMVFVLFGSRAFGLIAAYFRGEAPHQGPVHPGEVGLQRAMQLASKGDVSGARDLAVAALDTDPSLPT
jgi:Zn-dependent protease